MLKVVDLATYNQAKKELERVFETEPEVNYGVGVLYQSSGPLPSGTNRQLPHWLLWTNEGIKVLEQLGYQRCQQCNGDGWDADWGGIFICGTCKGRGAIKMPTDIDYSQVELRTFKQYTLTRWEKFLNRFHLLSFYLKLATVARSLRRTYTNA